MPAASSPLAQLAPSTWRNPALRAAFAIGFLILFAFIGTFTYVNFVLVRPPLALGMMALGFVYLVFLPSIVTTPLAGRAVARYRHAADAVGARFALAIAGLPLLLGRASPPCCAGLALIGVGTFFAQATRDRLRRPRRHDRSRLGERPLSRELFLGGLAGSRRARPGLRSFRLDALASPASRSRSPPPPRSRYGCRCPRRRSSRRTRSRQSVPIP